MIIFKIVTKHETKSVAEGCLTPNQAPCVDDLCCSVDIPPSNPRGSHREDPHEHPDVPASKHGLFLSH